ncbi:rap guanine nucleotide exchange factor 6-like isoform X5 [Anneissia japonica]|uniref:rap guanine nucleotide exchange factor 6-like isoform X5 n=1 Tax=Anneissia japonica TaxID=1529436 RepID=UPI001425B66E|nr:rap guanine nucleotide exchange factor 6-like isoform X5 [Anneissia japonica]
MASYVDKHFVNILKKKPVDRTQEDLQYVYKFLHTLEALQTLREPALRSLCRTVHYEKHEPNELLYRHDDLSHCWYILLSGSVFIDSAMFLARSSFGKRTSGSGRRGSECLILETSELLVIEYPDAQLLHPGQRQSCTTMNLEKLLALEQDEVKVAPARSNHERQYPHSDSEKMKDRVEGLRRGPMHAPSTPTSISSRSSVRSSISSTGSYSDLCANNDNFDLEYNGGGMDSDDEETSESSGSILVRDIVRDCLEKEPSERTEDEIEILLDFMRHLPAFANMTMSVRRALCAVMVFAVVGKGGTVVMKDEEELDSWSVILNGSVVISRPDGLDEHLHLGDSFGVKPTLEKQVHRGVMRTQVDDCQFVCITQEDYFHILTQGEENIRRIEENGTVVMVTEHRILDERRQGHVVIKATNDRLIHHLIDDHSPVDPTFVEDFLMTYRTFLKTPSPVYNRLLSWFHEPDLRDRVTRVVLLWVNNHYNDFESNRDMIEFLERFEELLEVENMSGQLRLLHIAGAAKAKKRTVTLARSDRTSPLSFTIIGGWEKKMGLFISKVEKGSKAHEAGLRRGDQIHEVNGHNFDRMMHVKALDIIQGTTHLVITVKYNTLAFRDLLASQEGRNNSHRRASQDIALLQADPRARHTMPDASVSPEIKDKKDKKGHGSIGHKTKLRKAIAKLSILPNKSMEGTEQRRAQDDTILKRSTTTSSQSSGSSLHHSSSNPDLTSLSTQLYEPIWSGMPDHPEHVLKVFVTDPPSGCKYFLVHKETSAKEVVMLAMQEFGLTGPQNFGRFSLCEVTVANEGLIKQKRFPEHMQNIAEKLSLNGRLYLKNNESSEPLVTDDIAVELMKESQVSLLQLNTAEVAVQLTLKDFEVFQNIEPTEYIEDLFKIKTKHGTDRLKAFEELVNQEMFWVVTEICSEPNIIKRMKIIKHYIKLARHCKDTKNFNSMFAIISGLGHGSVSRLRNTWDKLPNKYTKTFVDLQDLMDPSRNMSKYRNLVNAEHVHPPTIPFFPITKKDLTFIHLGNDSEVEGLINFEKLRMIAKEVRFIMGMASTPYDPRGMFDQSSVFGAPNPSVAHAVVAAVSGPTQQQRKKNNTAKRGSTFLNPKKMWEEAQMARRVRLYLQNMHVITNETELRELSLKCEPLPSSNTGTLSRRKSLPDLAVNAVNQTNINVVTSPVKKNEKNDQIKKIIYKDAPKTSFGATSPTTLHKLLMLSEEGDRGLKSMPFNRISAANNNSSKGPSPRHSPKMQPHGRRKEVPGTRDTGMNPAPPLLRSQRSDSGLSMSSMGSLDMYNYKRRHTVAAGSSGPPSITFSSSYESSDSGQSGLSSNYDTQSNSSLGSASPPVKDKRKGQREPAASIYTSPPPRSADTPDNGHAHRMLTPPDYNTARKRSTSSLAVLYSAPRQEMIEKKPPNYAVAKTMTRNLGGVRSRSCDYYDSDEEQVSVV